VVLLALSLAFWWLSISYVHPWVASWLPEAESAVGGALVTGLSALVTIAVGLIGVIVALALAPPLSGPALEKIIALEEVELGAPPRENLGFWSEVWCGLRAQLFVWMLASPLLLLLWLVELFVPPAVVVTLPLKLAVTSFTLAWNLLDYPLTLRQVRMRDRWQLFARYKLACLGFGAALSLLFWVPCGCQVILLPVGAAGASELVWKLLRHDPEFARSLLGVEPSVLVDANPEQVP
jgi:uncharacterized protein involved in cysteine biosynthesis